MTAIFFLFVFFTGCTLALARHPIFGLMTYVAVYYLHPPSRWWGASIPDLRWSLLAAGITLIAVLLHGKKLQTPNAIERRAPLVGYCLFVGWLLLQFPFALEPQMHTEMTVLYIKYALLIWLMTKAIDCEKHLLWFCWTHVFGCLYLGYIAFTSYNGGRFEDFGGPDISEANAGALQLVSGVFIGAALFLLPSVKQKIGLLLTMPLIANAIVLTSSRSAFLASTAGGLLFNMFAPQKVKWLVRILSILAVVAFFSLTTADYWTRISTITQGGAEVEGVDTGSGRLVLMKAQLQMFGSYPFGCGHRCTVTLSPKYLDEKHLTGTGEVKGRASHNTVMSLLVEQGIFGVTFYGLYLLWIAKMVLTLRKLTKTRVGLLPTLAPGIAAFMLAITIGDIFVDYLKSEVRTWFISLLVVAVHLARKVASEQAAAQTVAPQTAGQRTSANIPRTS